VISDKPIDETERRVLQLLREVLPWQSAKKPIGPEMFLQSDLGIDSLGKMALLFRIEEEFGIDLMDSTERLAQIRTVEELVLAAREFLRTN
jgi:acyl carrier protein